MLMAQAKIVPRYITVDGVKYRRYGKSSRMKTGPFLGITVFGVVLSGVLAVHPEITPQLATYIIRFLGLLAH
jgi:hypothetical protein